MGILEFKKRFSQEIDVDEVKRNFVHNINHSIIEPLTEKIGHYYFDSNPIFNFICLGLNLNPSSVVANFNRNNFGSSSDIPPLRRLTNDDFDATLVVIELACEYFLSHQEYESDMWIKSINKAVERFLQQIISLKIYWYEGKFYPEGAKELDDRLIKDNLDWLDQYPKVKELFRNALDHYAQAVKDPIKNKDVIINSFQAVEELARKFTATNKAFDNIFNEVVKKLDLTSQWGNILNFYNEISKEFGRHSGRKEEYIPKRQDTEAFLYLSGLLLKLMLGYIMNQSKIEKQNL